MTASHSELLQLKNLGMASVNILRAIGINTHADLKRMGAVEVKMRALPGHTLHSGMRYLFYPCFY